MIEPENAKGEAFGDFKLEQVILDAQMCQPSHLIQRLLDEIRRWQPVSMAQQDDITVVAMEVLEPSRLRPSEISQQHIPLVSASE